MSLDTAIRDALARRPDTVPDERTFKMHMRALEALLGPDWETDFTASTWARVSRAGTDDGPIVAVIGRQLPLAFRITSTTTWPERLERWLQDHNYVVVEAPSWREPVFTVEPALLAHALGIADVALIERDLTSDRFSLARLWFVTD